MQTWFGRQIRVVAHAATRSVLMRKTVLDMLLMPLATSRELADGATMVTTTNARVNANRFGRAIRAIWRCVKEWTAMITVMQQEPDLVAHAHVTRGGLDQSAPSSCAPTRRTAPQAARLAAPGRTPAGATLTCVRASAMPEPQARTVSFKCATQLIATCTARQAGHVPLVIWHHRLLVLGALVNVPKVSKDPLANLSLVQMSTIAAITGKQATTGPVLPPGMAGRQVASAPVPTNGLAKNASTRSAPG